MPKTASKKSITADKFLDLEKRGLAESMVSGGKRRRKACIGSCTASR